MPDGAAFRTSAGPDGRRWSQLEAMLADAIDLLGVMASDMRLRNAYEYDRPRYPEATPAASDMADVAAFFGMRYASSDGGDQEETAG